MSIQPMVHLVLPVIIWSPIEQFANVAFTCPKCSLTTEPGSSCQNLGNQKLSPIAWTNGCSSKYLPRLLHDVNSNVLLLSRVYQCSFGHDVYAHHPGLVKQCEIFTDVPFYLWHSIGFTQCFIDFVNHLVWYGMSMKDGEKSLQEKRVITFYRIQSLFMKNTLSSSTVAGLVFPSIDSVTIWKGGPTRHAVTGCFLYSFWKNEQSYITEMMAGSVSSDDLWLSCDHTFKSIANFGLFRVADGKWVKQYTGLFCVLNPNGEVLTWKLTKNLRFETIQDQLKFLQERLTKDGKTIKEFYIDNCCSWRKKLQQVFGSDLKVLLDIFHAVQRVTTKISKRHPFHSQCISDLKMAFRDPSDKGPIRTKSTPGSAVIRLSLEEFQQKWEHVAHEGVKILPLAAVEEINCILKHVDRGCLSNIMPGRGTNRNERLHRDLNQIVSSSRYGVELGYALITCTFHRHNEKIRCNREKRSPKPIIAVTDTHDSATLERFGLDTACSRTESMPEAHTSEVQQTTTLNDIPYTLFNAKMNFVLSRSVEDDYDESTSEDNSSGDRNEDSILTREEAIAILRQSITHYYILRELFQGSKTITLDKLNILFISFLSIVKNFSGARSQSVADEKSLVNLLSQWNFQRVEVPKDGNCIFSSVAMALMERVQRNDIAVMTILQQLGISSDSTNQLEMHTISRVLRTLVVQEWLGEHSDYYQNFVTADIRSQAQNYLRNGEFAGNLGDLMVVTLSNILHIPIVLFTNVVNLPVVCITPVSGTESTVPLYLIFDHNGPGHYDYAIPKVTSPSTVVTSKVTKCYCGRKKDFMGTPCLSDFGGHCRCPCARKSLPCKTACRCNHCSNINGVRPPPSTTRKRESYETQKQALSGRKGSDFLKSVNEQESVGHTTDIEKLIFTAIIIHFLHCGIDVSTEKVHSALSQIVDTSKVCTFIVIPIYKRSQRYIAHYLRGIEQLTALFKQLMH